MRFFGRGRREQEDRIDVVLLHQRRELEALLRRIVDHDHAVDAGRFRRGGELLEPIASIGLA
jgi:hypothetical protein